VMTVMNILWRKGLLSRAKDLREGHARAWWYEARVTREEHLAAVIRAALECAPDPATVMRRAVVGKPPMIETKRETLCIKRTNPRSEPDPGQGSWQPYLAISALRLAGMLGT
jgi:hypothetical protein